MGLQTKLGSSDLNKEIILKDYLASLGALQCK